jgi:hypothetical protein
MTSLPPLPLQTSPVASQQAQAALALVGKATDLLNKMGVRQQITATVTAQAGNGLVEVATGQGNYQLRLPIPVPAGSQLLLQQSPAGQLRLVAVNGELLTSSPSLPGATLSPAGLLIATLPPGQMPPAPGAPSGLAQQQDLIQIGARPGTAILASGPGGPLPGLLATVISGPPTGFATQGVAAFPIGTQLTLRVSEVIPPGAPTFVASAPNQAPSPMSAGASLPGAPTASLPQPGTTAPQPATSPIQAEVPGKAPPHPQAGVPQQPGAPASGAPATVSPPLRGEVLAAHYGNRPVIAAPFGTVTLDAPLDLPPGSTVTVEVIRAQAPPAAMAAAARDAAAAPPTQFSALRDAMEILSRAAPAEAEALMRSLPQAGPRLALAMMATVQSLRTGDVKGTPTGAAGRALEGVGQKEAARKLLGEFEDNAVEAKRGGGDWRAHAIPFLNGAEIEEIQLYTRPPPEEADPDGERSGNGRDDGSRFLVNITLSRLGAMQFDGLVRRESKRFDLIIRTQEPLPSSMRNDIAGLFAHACELSGVSGQVGFQAGRPFVAVDAEPAAMRSGVVV